MARSERLDAVVVAGGHSSRMGAFKPLLPLGDSTVLEQAIATFRGVAAQVWVVVGHRGGELEPVIRLAGARCVVNPDFEQGMFTSIQAGLRALPGQVAGCFVLPADLPLVRPHTARALAAAFHRTGAEVVHPRFVARGHPPLLSARLIPEVLAGGEGGLRAVLSRHEAHALDVEVLDEGVLLDLDTRSDYARGLRLDRERVGPTMREAQALLQALGAPDHLVLHSRAVTLVALRLAAAVSAEAVWVDPSLVSAGAMLHDVCKGSPDHALAGARLLRRLGYPHVARIIARHMDQFFAPGALPDEAALVYLADKLVRGELLCPLRERLDATLSRHGRDEAARAAILQRYDTAEHIAEAIRALTGLDALDVARVPHGEALA